MLFERIKAPTCSHMSAVKKVYCAYWLSDIPKCNYSNVISYTCDFLASISAMSNWPVLSSRKRIIKLYGGTCAEGESAVIKKRCLGVQGLSEKVD